MVRVSSDRFVEDQDTKSDQQKYNADIEEEHWHSPHEQQAPTRLPPRGALPASFGFDADESADAFIAVFVRVDAAERNVLLHGRADGQKSIEQSAIPTGCGACWQVVEGLPSQARRHRCSDQSALSGHSARFVNNRSLIGDPYCKPDEIQLSKSVGSPSGYEFFAFHVILHAQETRRL